MDAINDDMLAAVKELGLHEAEERLLIEVLFNERVHKSEEWSGDAVQAFQTMIDEAFEAEVSK